MISQAFVRNEPFPDPEAYADPEALAEPDPFAKPSALAEPDPFAEPEALAGPEPDALGKIISFTLNTNCALCYLWFTFSSINS